MLAISALLVSITFGCLFLVLETFSDKLVEKIQRPLPLAILAGLLLGSLAMISPYFLFSGEHNLLPLSENYQQITAGFLLFLAVGKNLFDQFFFCLWLARRENFPGDFCQCRNRLCFCQPLSLHSWAFDRDHRDRLFITIAVSFTIFSSDFIGLFYRSKIQRVLDQSATRKIRLTRKLRELPQLLSNKTRIFLLIADNTSS